MWMLIQKENAARTIIPWWWDKSDTYQWEDILDMMEIEWYQAEGSD